MPEREIMTQTMNVTDARQQFSQLLNQVFKGKTRVLLERSGIPVAGIVSARDLELLQEMEAKREKDFSILDEIGAAFKDVSDDELEREVQRAIAAARQQASPSA